jgi:hypothetical protein
MATGIAACETTNGSGIAILQNMRKKEDDECDLFGKIIAKKLKKYQNPKEKN